LRFLDDDELPGSARSSRNPPVSTHRDDATCKIVFQEFLQELDEFERIRASLKRTTPGSQSEAEQLSRLRRVWTALAARIEPGPGPLRDAIVPFAGPLVIDEQLRKAWTTVIDILASNQNLMIDSTVHGRFALDLTLSQLAGAKEKLVRYVNSPAEHPAPQPPSHSPGEPASYYGFPFLVDLSLDELIKQLELFEEDESGRDDENRTYWHPPPDAPYPPPDRREEIGKKLIGKPGFWTFAAVCAHSTRTGLPEAEFAKRLRDSLATRLDCSPKEIGRRYVREVIEKYYGPVPLHTELFEAPPSLVLSSATDAAERKQGPETSNEHTAPLPEAPSDSTGSERVQPANQPAVQASAEVTKAEQVREARLKPGARAIAAAYELKKEGRPVSLNAACKRARVDRDNLRRNHPEAVRTIKALSAPDRPPRRGTRDQRTGDIDAVDEAED
jgi:hypothetical protein